MEFIKIESEPKYEISKTGIIRNIITKKPKKQYLNSMGYPMISISHKNQSNPHRVHRLLANTFIPNPENLPEINHKDGNKTNNHLNNLEWCTHLENMNHAFTTGLANNTGIQNGMSKLNDMQAKEIKLLLDKGISQYKISKLYNVSRSAILKIKLNKTWKHVI